MASQLPTIALSPQKGKLGLQIPSKITQSPKGKTCSDIAPKEVDVGGLNLFTKRNTFFLHIPKAGWMVALETLVLERGAGLGTCQSLIVTPPLAPVRCAGAKARQEARRFSRCARFVVGCACFGLLVFFLFWGGQHLFLFDSILGWNRFWRVGAVRGL